MTSNADDMEDKPVRVIDLGLYSQNSATTELVEPQDPASARERVKKFSNARLEEKSRRLAGTLNMGFYAFVFGALFVIAGIGLRIYGPKLRPNSIGLRVATEIVYVFGVAGFVTGTMLWMVVPTTEIDWDQYALNNPRPVNKLACSLLLYLVMKARAVPYLHVVPAALVWIFFLCNRCFRPKSHWVPFTAILQPYMVLQIFAIGMEYYYEGGVGCSVSSQVAELSMRYPRCAAGNYLCVSASCLGAVMPWRRWRFWRTGGMHGGLPSLNMIYTLIGYWLSLASASLIYLAVYLSTNPVYEPPIIALRLGLGVVDFVPPMAVLIAGNRLFYFVARRFEGNRDRPKCRSC